VACLALERRCRQPRRALVCAEVRTARRAPVSISALPGGGQGRAGPAGPG